MGLAKEVWARLKKLTVTKVPAPDTHSRRTWSILAPLEWRAAKIRRKLAGQPNTLSNQKRVVAGRAKRMGISVSAYEARYPRLS